MADSAVDSTGKGGLKLSLTEPLEQEIMVFAEGAKVDGKCVLANGSSRWYVCIGRVYRV